MSAAKEFLRLSQQNLAAMDEAEATSPAPRVSAQQALPTTGRALDSDQQQSPQNVFQQPAKAPSMLPANSFLAMLHGKSQAPVAKPADTVAAVQMNPLAQGSNAPALLHS